MKRQVYAALCKDEPLRLSSSSGGIFPLLAQAVLAKGGAVFGAAFSDDLTVRHIAITDPADLPRLQGSKYVRSHLGDSYRQAKEFLDDGKTVLFTGSPCQIAGLKAYLKEDYVNLICQDIACHGAPMPSVWDDYVNHREQQAGSKPTAVRFRDKVTGWEAYSLTMDFADGSKYTCRVDRDPYMKAFLREYTLGASCYHCAHKGLDRQADITLADLWGAAETCPQLHDNKGISAVFLHTEKGAALWNEILPQLTAIPIAEDAVVRHNPALLHSAPQPKDREKFLSRLNATNFPETVDRFCPRPSLLRRALARLKRLTAFCGGMLAPGKHWE